MQFSLVLATLLCFTTWISLNHASPAHAPLTNCCLQWSRTRLHTKQIKNYTVQSDSVCPMKAIVFLTGRGKRVCSSPETDWVKKAILKVDRVQKELLDKKATTIGVTLASSTASTQGQNDEGSTSGLPDSTTRINYKKT